MKRALIDPKKCLKCADCGVAAQCPQKAIIREEPTDMPWVDFQLCRGCMKCKAYCKNKAILEALKPCDGNPRQSW